VAKFDTFEEIVAWQRAKELTTACCKETMENKDFSFRDQIRRACVSIMNNIAEGFERNSNKEFRNFLFITKGSCAEVRSMLNLALELKYISKEVSDNLKKSSLEISKMLSGLIKTLQTL
jgi:four helix bundle protein